MNLIEIVKEKVFSYIFFFLLRKKNLATDRSRNTDLMQASVIQHTILVFQWEKDSPVKIVSWRVFSI